MNAGPICGNGILETSEECDDGNTQNGDLCASNCLCGFDELDPKSPGAAFVDANQSSCYLLFAQSQSFNNAEQVCMSKSMHLATISTLKELEFLHPFIEAFTQVWIGGMRAAPSADIWTWISGEAWAIQPCEVNKVPTCDNGMVLWAIGEPNNNTGSEDCVEIYNGSALGFNDAECSAIQPFVCERPFQPGM